MKPNLKFTVCLLIAGIAFFSCKKDKTSPVKSYQPPIANAGKDKIVILPVDSIELTGSGMDADGLIVSYAWSNVSGPSSFMFVNPANANAKVKNLVRGIYEFELTVTDNDNLFTTDKAFILVLDSLNDPLNGGCAGCWDY